MRQWRRIGPKLLVAGGVLQGVLPRVDGQLDVLGKAGVGGWLPVLALVALGLAWEVHQRRESTVDVADDGRVRAALVDSVRAQWVSGVLERSLEAVARVEVGLTRRPEAVDHPWGTLVAPDRRPVSSLAEVHDRDGLLLLGEPGAGKTTALLELARVLLDRAAADPAEPVPVVFHLSSWAARHTSLAEWLVDELVKRYGVPRGVAREWVRVDAVLPLLDGLDEVDPAWREDCTAAINAWRGEHGLSGVVVCARTADYERLRTRLALGAAVVLEPLGRKEVLAHLRGRPLAGLRTALRQDPRLLDLLTTPLMLSVYVLAYAGVPADRVRADPLGDYVAAMLARPRSGLTRPRFTPAQTRRHLSWLASAMDRHHESVFYPDWVQLSWLPTRALRVRAALGPALAVSLVTAAASVAFYGYCLAIGLGWRFFGQWSVYWVPFAVVAALAVLGRRIAPARPWRWRTLRPVLRRLTLGGGVGIAVAVAAMTAPPWSNLGQVPVLTGLVASVVTTTAGALVAVLADRVADVVVRARATRHGVRCAAGAGATAAGAVCALGLLYRLEHPQWGLSPLAAVLGLAAWTFAHARPTPDLAPATPGAGMRRSLRQGWTAFAVVLVCGTVVAHVQLHVFSRAGGAREVWLVTPVLVFFAALAGWLAALKLGLGDWLRHRAVLRLLARRGYLPGDLLGFLDHADSHILLRCTGRGYAFVHRMFLDHFAGKGPGVPETLPTPRPSPGPLSPGPAPGGGPRP
ncbi:MAG: NACHT domain-containing protein, partial [Saccharothrix sp.]|nr:NACHT domain-containing protein [Saccharothrix sp.]